MRKPSAITESFHDPINPIGVARWIEIGAEIQELFDLPSLIDYIVNPYNGILPFLTGDLPQEDDFETLKDKILINVIAERISYYYHNEKTVMGKKDDRVKNFFAAITNEPQDFHELLHEFNIAENTVKNFSRHDHLKHIGKVKRKTTRTTNRKTKKTMIWRETQTVDGFKEQLQKDLNNL